MGILLSRFRRKQTTIEILEDIDKEIHRLQRNRKANQDRQKQFVTSLLIYSIIIYIIVAVIFFLVYFPDTWLLRFLYSLPLLIFPFLIWGIKKLLHWYFVKRIASNDLALQELRERKKQILEDVMETETYKKAREILEKFDPGRLRKLEAGSPDSSTQVNMTSTPGTVVQQRTVRTTQQVHSVSPVAPRMTGPSTPAPVPMAPRPRPPVPQFTTPPAVSQPQTMPQPRTPFPSQPIMRGGYSAAPPGLPMARSILPRERGTMDKLMDYLVGDGPENRYALICQHCFSHNGMALKEEFEYLSFRCCYCYNLNPAKKQRPLAPRLEFFAPPGNRQGQTSGIVPSNEESDDDDVDKDDDDYSDQESLESDTSAGISPLESVNSTLMLASESSKSLPPGGQASKIPKSKEPASSKPHVMKQPKLELKKPKSELKEQKPDDLKGPKAGDPKVSKVEEVKSVNPPTVSGIPKLPDPKILKVEEFKRVNPPTVSGTPKVPEGQASKTTGSRVPIAVDTRTPKVIESASTKMIESSTEKGIESSTAKGIESATTKVLESATPKDVVPASSVHPRGVSDLSNTLENKSLTQVPGGLKQTADNKSPPAVADSAGLDAGQQKSSVADAGRSRVEGEINGGPELTQNKTMSSPVADTQTSSGASVDS